MSTTVSITQHSMSRQQVRFPQLTLLSACLSLGLSLSLSVCMSLAVFWFAPADFLPFGASPDPVRRLIGDETLNSTLRDSHTHSSPSKSARSNDHHPYDTRGQISRSSRSHNSSKSSSHKSRSSNHDRGTASPLSRKSQSARTSPAHGKGYRDVSPR